MTHPTTPAVSAGLDMAFASADVEVRGTSLTVSDNQAAAARTLLFLHGAVTDLRMWDRHRRLLGAGYRTLAYTQRYHGTAPWPEGGPAYGVRTHADDLIALLDHLKPGPVHLVAWSYAGHVAFDAALRRPELLRSLFVYEPGVPSYVEDAGELQAHGQDAMAAFGAVFEAQARGDDVEAMKRMLDASGQVRGCFDAQDAQSQRIQLENARTMRLLLLQQEPPPAITAAQLSRLPALGVRACVGHGASSRPLYAIPARAAQRCIPGEHLVAEGANHMWPDARPGDFVQAVMRFVEQG